MSAANRRDPARVTRYGKPIVDRRPDPPAPDGRFARTMVTGYQQDDPFAGVACPLQGEIDRVPRTVEIHPVQIDHAIGLHGPGAELAVPCPVQRCAGAKRPRRQHDLSNGYRRPRNGRLLLRWRFYRRLRLVRRLT